MVRSPAATATATAAAAAAAAAAALVFALSLAVPLGAAWAQGDGDDDQPNIVFLVADDLGYGELGCQGNAQIPTPHIDSIATNGVRFTNGYVTAPFCSASRAGLLTGRYQTRFGHEFNPTGAHNEDPAAGLPAGQRTIADHLRNEGYATALIGKWHLGGTARYNPMRRGFDEFFGFLHEGHYYLPPPWRGATTMLRRKGLPGGKTGRWTSADETLIHTTHMGHNEPDYDADNPIYRAGQPVEEEQFLTDALTREAVDFIDRSKDRPFFLYLAYNAVHSPLQGAEAWMENFSHIEDIHRRIFAAMLGNLDASVGAVLEKLRDAGLEENTLVFFISDNGGPTRELTSSNAPLRGGKGQVYEGGLRVPFLAQWKGRIGAGTEYHQPVISLDMFATAARKARVGDGVDLMPYLAEEKKAAPHGELYWRIGTRRALRSGDWKILQQPGRRSGDSSKWELYHLASDLGEKKNLADENSDILRQLVSRWEVLNAEMIDPVWSANRKQ